MSETIYDDVTLEMNSETTEIMDSVRNDELMKNTGKMSTEKQQALQHTGRVSVKNRRHRSVQVCLCLLSVLLLTALIVICVYFTNETNKLLTHNYNLTKEREELLTHNYNLTKEREELLTHNYNLTKEREELLTHNYNLTEEREELCRWLTEQDRHSDNFKWVYYNCSFYYISSEYKSWSDSRRDCEQRGTNLVIINNKEEQEFVQKAIAGQYYYWIGLSQERGEWKWTDDTTVTLSLWIYGHPRHNHTCAVTSSSGWVSYLCNGNQRWICEKRILQSLII